MRQGCWVVLETWKESLTSLTDGVDETWKSRWRWCVWHWAQDHRVYWNRFNWSTSTGGQWWNLEAVWPKKNTQMCCMLISLLWKYHKKLHDMTVTWHHQAAPASWRPLCASESGGTWWHDAARWKSSWQWYQGCPSMSHLHPSRAPRSFWSALSFDTLCSDCNTRHLQSSTSPPEGQTEFNLRHLRTKKFLPSSCKRSFKISKSARLHKHLEEPHQFHVTCLPSQQAKYFNSFRNSRFTHTKKKTKDHKGYVLDSFNPQLCCKCLYSQSKIRLFPPGDHQPCCCFCWRAPFVAEKSLPRKSKKPWFVLYSIYSYLPFPAQNSWNNLSGNSSSCFVVSCLLSSNLWSIYIYISVIQLPTVKPTQIPQPGLACLPFNRKM